MLIKASLEKPMIYNTDNIKQYIKEDNLLKSDYFYTLDAQVANLLESVDKEMYFEIYQILFLLYRHFRR